MREIPKKPNEAVRKIAADSMAAILIRDCPELGNVAEISSDLLKIHSGFCSDGYKLARELETRCGWDCNMQIAEALDCYDKPSRGPVLR